jgi:hypothetical protein
VRPKQQRSAEKPLRTRSFSHASGHSRRSRPSVVAPRSSYAQSPVATTVAKRVFMVRMKRANGGPSLAAASTSTQAFGKAVYGVCAPLLDCLMRYVRLAKGVAAASAFTDPTRPCASR